MAIPQLGRRVSIAELEPELALTEDASVHGVVTLFWPYASSTKSLSLLLVEPDFRLRRYRGQVRVHFKGPTAVALAKSHVSSGDQLALSLKQASWKKTLTPASTPGRSVDWELFYGQSARLTVARTGQEFIPIDVDDPMPSPESAAPSTLAEEVSFINDLSPPTIKATKINGLSQNNVWASPAFLKRSRPFSSSFDPFAEDLEEFSDNERRKKTKFGQGMGQWKFTDRTPSPEKEDNRPTVLPDMPSSPDAVTDEVVESTDTMMETVASTGDLEGGETVIMDPIPDDANRSPSIVSISESESSTAEEVRPRDDTKIHVGQSKGNATPEDEVVEQTLRQETAIEDQKPYIQEPELGILDPQVQPQESTATPIPPDPTMNGEDVDAQEAQQVSSIIPDAADYGMDGTSMSRPISAGLDMSFDEIGFKWAEAQELASELQIPDSPVTSFDGFQPQGDSSLSEIAQLPAEDATMKSYEDLQIPAQAAQPYLGFTPVNRTDSAPTFQDVEAERGDQAVIEALPPQHEPEKVDYDRLAVPPDHEDHVQASTLFREDHESPERRSENNESGSQAQSLQADELAEHRDSNEVEIIQIERDDEDDAQRQLAVPPPITESLGSSFATEDAVKPTASPDPLELRQENDVWSEVSSVVNEDKQLLLVPPDSSESGQELSNLSESIDFKEAPMSEEAEIADSDTARPLVPQPSAFEILPPSLPSTVQESIDTTSISILPPNIQNDDVISQPTTISPQSEPFEEVMSVPHLTQDTSAGLTAPEPPEQQVPPSPLQAPALPIEETGKRNRTKQVESPEAIPTAEVVSEDTIADAIVTDARKRAKTKPRETSLVRRLKEQRRLSSLNPNSRMSASSSASPWFAHRRPGGQSANEPQDEPERQTAPRPRKREVPISPATSSPPTSRLSTSFIRSSPVLSSPKSSPSSLQHQPASQRATGFRTKFSYFVPLSSLHCHYGTEVDVLANVVVTKPIVKAESGPKDHVLSIYLVDPSSIQVEKDSSRVTTTAQFFRPRKTSFPRTITGDVILLRNFKVQSFQKHLALICTESSAWAVFREDCDVQVRGPPVEFGPEERAFARAQWNWWESLGLEERESSVAAASQIEAFDGKVKTPKKAKKGLGFEIPVSRSKKGQNKKSSASQKGDSVNDEDGETLKERSVDLDGTVDTGEEEQEVVAPELEQRRVLRSRNIGGSTPSSPEKEFVKKKKKTKKENLPVHELRDGTRYVDGDEKPVHEESKSQRNLRVHELRDGRTYRDRE